MHGKCHVAAVASVVATFGVPHSVCHSLELAMLYHTPPPPQRTESVPRAAVVSPHPAMVGVASSADGSASAAAAPRSAAEQAAILLDRLRADPAASVVAGLHL